MPQEKDTGTGARSPNDAIAGTGPGILDDVLAPGEALPTPLSEEQIAVTARKLDVPVSDSGEAT